MNTQLPPNPPHHQKTIESIAIKKILNKIPEAAKFLKLIKFVHKDDKASLDLALLPRETAILIEELFD